MSSLPSHSQGGNIWHWGTGKAERGIYLWWPWAQGSKFSIILSLKPAGSTSVPAVTLISPSVGEWLLHRGRKENKSFSQGICAVVTCRAVRQHPPPAAPERARDAQGPAVPFWSPSLAERVLNQHPAQIRELEVFLPVPQPGQRRKAASCTAPYREHCANIPVCPLKKDLSIHVEII